MSIFDPTIVQVQEAVAETYDGDVAAYIHDNCITCENCRTIYEGTDDFDMAECKRTGVFICEPCMECM